MNRCFPRLFSWLMLASICPLVSPGAEAPAPTKSQFIYILRLVPRLHGDDAWTPQDNDAIGRHFAHLKEATARGEVICVGRTMETKDRTFGLVIFEATDATAAQAFAASDPAVVAGVMTFEVHPFAVFLQRKS